MFGGGEILIIALVAIIVVDPKKLPDLMKSLGKAINEFKGMSSEFKRTIERETEAADFAQRKTEAEQTLFGPVEAPQAQPAADQSASAAAPTPGAAPAEPAAPAAAAAPSVESAPAPSEGVPPEAVPPEAVPPEAVPPEVEGPAAAQPAAMTSEGVSPKGVQPEAATMAVDVPLGADAAAEPHAAESATPPASEEQSESEGERPASEAPAAASTAPESEPTPTPAASEASGSTGSPAPVEAAPSASSPVGQSPEAASSAEGGAAGEKTADESSADAGSAGAQPPVPAGAAEPPASGTAASEPASPESASPESASPEPTSSETVPPESTARESAAQESAMREPAEPPAETEAAAPPAPPPPPPPPLSGDEAVGEGEAGRMSLFDHLRDLRKRLTRSVIAVVVGFFVCYAFAGKMLTMLMQPMLDVLKQSHFIYTVPTEAFFTEMKVAFVAGIFLASPYIFYQLWEFVAPGLYSHEKRWVLPIAFFSAVFFTAGAMFGYFVVFPFGFEFFASYTSNILTFMPKLDEYLDFVLKLLFAFGIVFELPLFLFFLARLGLVTHVGLRKKRKYAILVAFVLAAALTPPDAVSQTMMAVPLCVLYEVGIWVAYFFGKKPKPKPKPEAEAGGDAAA